MERPEISSFDSSSESINEVDVAAVNMAASPSQITTRRKRSVGTREPSCFSGTYKMTLLSNGVKVKEPVCLNVTSDNSKCTTGATQECEPHYVKMNIWGETFKIAKHCKCKV